MRKKILTLHHKRVLGLTFLRCLIIIPSISLQAQTPYQAPSRLPPGGLAIESVPLFVSIGFDDNQSDVETTLSVLDKYKNPTRIPNSDLTYDGMPTRVSYFHTTNYNTFGALTSAWELAAAKGHETGNHTHTHANGANYDQEEWNSAVETANTNLLMLNGVDTIYGFRTPFLAHNDSLFSVLQNLNFRYDCSIEEGEIDNAADGTNFHWPYTLDNGSPEDPDIGTHSGLWELPVYALMVIPDDKLVNYGLPREHSMIEKLGGPKITGFDYNLIVKGITGNEFTALLKYNLDLRLEGNRAPLLFGAHTANYVGESSPYTLALSEFIEYATSKPEVRIVPFIEIVRWMETPVGFSLDSKIAYRVSTSIIPEVIPPENPCTEEAWDSAKAYSTGDRAGYDNKLWEAKWWTQGNTPGSSDVWNYISDCEGDTLLYHGSVTPNGLITLEDGSDLPLTIQPNPGYTVSKIVINGEEFSSDLDFTLTDIRESKTVEIYFKLDTSWKTHASNTAKSYADWCTEKGFNGEEDEDFDKDGIINYLEFFFGKNPETADLEFLSPSIQMLNVNSIEAPYFTIDIDISTEALVEYKIETKIKLSDSQWNSGNEHFVFHSENPSANGTSQVRWRSPFSINANSSKDSLFIRIKARNPTP